MTQIQMIHIAFELWASIFCFLAMAIVLIIKGYDKWLKLILANIMFITGMLNISEALAYFYRGNTTGLGYVMVRVTNFVVFLCGYLLVIEASHYVARVVTKNSGEYDGGFSNAVTVIELAGILLLICSRIFKFYYAFDENNRYYRLDNHWIMIFIAIIGIILIFADTVVHFKNLRLIQSVSFISYEVTPILALLFQVTNYGISLYTLVITVNVVFMCLSYFIDNSYRFRVEERRLDQERIMILEKEVELNEEKVKLYHSQIQPHFIFNTLTLLRSYLGDPEKAEDILNSFTAFLRNTVDMFSERECVPITRELGIVENYLFLGKERFGDKLDLQVTMADTEFEIPPFTIQTVVENAIVHGIRGNKDGKGTLFLRSYRTNEYHVVEVEDNGVGFDVSILDNSEYMDIEHKHIGLINIKKRLELMSKGRMEITSTIGEGTLVKILIPIEQKGE